MLLEHILTQDPHIKTALIFGRGRFNIGVLIEPTEQSKFDPADQEKLIEFRNKIWYDISFRAIGVSLILTPCRPTVERMNEFAPQHSRLFKEVRSHALTVQNVRSSSYFTATR